MLRHRLSVFGAWLVVSRGLLFCSVSLSRSTSLSIPTYLPIYLSTYLLTYLPTYLPTYRPTDLPPTYRPTYLPTDLSTYLPTYLPIYLSNCRSISQPINRYLSIPYYVHIIGRNLQHMGSGRYEPWEEA